MRRLLAALALSVALVTTIGGCALVDVIPFGFGGGDSEPYEPSPEELVVPERITVVPDDYNTELVGTLADGRHFFLHVTFCDGSTCLATFYWNADGTFDELSVEPVADDVDVAPLLDERFSDLDGAFLEPIEVAPFATDHDGEQYGFVPYPPDPEYPGDIASVVLEPANNVAYYWPWDGMGYDT